MKKTISQHLETCRNPHEIARLVGQPVSKVRDVMKKTDLAHLPGWGRVELQCHLISRKQINHETWPAADQLVILNHRRQHDQGQVTMCQGRDGLWILQYAIPRKSPSRRAVPYFGANIAC